MADVSRLLLVLHEGIGELGESPYLLFLIALLMSIITLHFLLRTFNNTSSATAKQHKEDGMIVCPECGKPTETEYRFCRFCAGDTGRSYVNMVDNDDSSQSGMF